MIRDFWVENYLSILERQEMNFEVRQTEDEWMRVEVSPGVFISKLGIIYGANASGKSNMLKALQNVFTLLFVHQNDRNQHVTGGEPFALAQDKPTEMYVSFYANGIRYDYTIVYDMSHVISESLEYYPKKSKSLFYERTYNGPDMQASVKFGPSIKMTKKTLATIVQNTLNNHTVLSTYGKVSLPADAQPMATLYNWIKQYVHGVMKLGDNDILSHLRKANEEERRKKFYMTMLKKADFNITDFRILSNGQQEALSFVNSTTGKDFELPSTTQSAGTMRYISNLRYLYDAIVGGHIYMLDELGDDMHYDLLLYYINVFLHNSDSSQLIFTSQETALLSESLINEHRHTVWFAEKSHETATSEYTRADQFGLHKNLSLYNSYRIGRLGARPELGSPFIELD